MELTMEQLTDLVCHGSIKLENGDLYRFIEEPDEYGSVNDFESYGRVEWRNDRGDRKQRPNWCDGMAEIIHTQSDSYWWQPPADLRKGWATSEMRPKLRQLVHDCLMYGFSVFRVELCRGVDAYGQPIVFSYQTMGGFEPFTDDDTKIESARDMIHWIAQEEKVAQ